ncbi:hypothetical protein [Dactylosporangium cerinum]
MYGTSQCSAARSYLRRASSGAKPIALAVTIRSVHAAALPGSMATASVSSRSARWMWSWKTLHCAGLTFAAYADVRAFQPSTTHRTPSNVLARDESRSVSTARCRNRSAPSTSATTRTATAWSARGGSPSKCATTPGQSPAFATRRRTARSGECSASLVRNGLS